MSIVAPPVPNGAPTRGRGVVIAGSVLLAVSVVGSMAAFALLAGRFDVAGLTRDVVISGDPAPVVPGEVHFSVDRALDGDESDTMTVGIAVEDDTGGTPECTMATDGGDDVPLSRSQFDPTLLNGSSDYVVVGSAALRSGDYTASCIWPGEPSQSPSRRQFTVGRTLGDDEFSSLLGPVLGMLAVAAIGGLTFVVGVVLLIVGLVQRSRSRRDPGGHGGAWPPQQWGPPAGPGTDVSGPGPQGPPTWTPPAAPGPPPSAFPPHPDAPAPPPGGPAHGGPAHGGPSPSGPATVDHLPHWPTPPGRR